MNINNNYAPSFEAIPLKQKAIQHPKYKLVELNVNNLWDILALEKITDDWLRERNKLGNNSCHYLRDIWNCAIRKRIPDKTDKNNYDNIQIFALTKQRFFFHLLNPQKLVAVAQMRIKNSFPPKIEYIETRPKYQHSNPKRKTKGIGTYFLNCLKTLVDGKKIVIYPDGHSTEFYRKYGAYPDENFPDLKCYI